MWQTQLQHEQNSTVSHFLPFHIVFNTRCSSIADEPRRAFLALTEGAP